MQSTEVAKVISIEAGFWWGRLSFANGGPTNCGMWARVKINASGGPFGRSGGDVYRGVGAALGQDEEARTKEMAEQFDALRSALTEETNTDRVVIMIDE